MPEKSDNETASGGTIINTSKIKEFIEKYIDYEDQTKTLKEKQKRLIDEYTQFTGVPDKKTLRTAIALAKKRGISMDDLDALVRIIEPMVAE